MNVGEIITAQQRNAVVAAPQFAPIFVQQWMDSPPHRSIVLVESLNANELGAGCPTASTRAASTSRCAWG